MDAEFDASIKAQNALRSLKVEYLPVAALWPALRTVRTHTKKQVRQLADSVTHFGFVRPIIVDARGQIVAGHGVWEAAKTLRLAEVPAIRISHLSDVEIRAYMLADNKLAEKAGWDRELLAIELKELEGLLPQIDLDLSITGFDSAEIDALMFDFGNERPNPADEIPDRHDGPAVSRLGDLFVFGKKHRLAVGDAQDPEGYPKLLRSELAAMAFLDPPYNVPIAGHVGGRGRTKHREFACAAGELTERQFIAFLEESLALCAKHSADGAIHYVCMDWRHCHELHVAGTRVFTELKNVCVWVKT
ncbi:ParB N-terminal domain-containing protein, partial [Pseudorhodoplanes sp.]|uniref:ParB N-terminal domain-containing protein n=1 Tax=Pseudorhodoplanes sp. TaxID=1934341 RepID=UPI003D149E48